MTKQERGKRRAANNELWREIGTILRKQYDDLPFPRSDLLDDLMERIEAEHPDVQPRRH
jgi:hypothetical protein